MVADGEEIMLITSEGVIIRLRAEDISTVGRASQGVKLINLSDGVKVAGAAKIAADQLEEENEQSAEKAEDIPQEVNEEETEQ